MHRTGNGARRRGLLAAGIAVAATGLVTGIAVAGPASITNDSAPDTTAAASTTEVDQPQGFTADILAGHSEFTDDVSARFRFRHDQRGNEAGAIVSNVPDAGTVVAADVTWEPSGTSGWHTHPGPVVVAVTEGSVVVTTADDCVSHTYEAGEAFIDPGQGRIHVASNASDTEQARANAMFFGVPDGGAATIWKAPVDC